MKRRIPATILALLLAAGATACTPSDTEAPEASEPVGTEEPGSIITDGVQTTDYYTVPPMTEEQRVYCDAWVEPLLYNGLLLISWSAEDYANISTAPGGRSESNNMIMAFEDLAGSEQMQQLRERYEADLPASVVEELLTDYFSFTPEQLREMMDICYDAQREIYYYEGGRGGGPVEAAVTEIEEEDGIVRLSYEMYTGYVAPEPSHPEEGWRHRVTGIMTLQQSEAGYRWYSVKADERVDTNAGRDIALRPEAPEQPPKPDVAELTGNVVILLDSSGQNSVTQSGSFTVRDGQKLVLYVETDLTGGAVDLFLFDPDGAEAARLTFTESEVQRIPLAAGDWAFNCTGFFESGSVTLTGTLED